MRSSCHTGASLSRISHGKSHGETALDWYKAATDPKLTRLAKIYELYEERLHQANALDFDDLLLESVRLLKHDEACGPCTTATMNT